jgi:DNA-binding CsgD family transcriptional regulator
VFGVIAVLAGADAAADLRSGLPLWNIGVDLTITAGAIIAGAVYWWRSVHFRRQTEALLRRLDAARADADRWRAEAASVLPALGAAIHRQFERWTLTPDEQHIALMLMSGLSSKQIAEVCHGNVRTVRQGTLDIYRKAGVTGRAALAAFFLQDLLYLAGHPTTRRQSPRPVVSASR